MNETKRTQEADVAEAKSGAIVRASNETSVAAVAAQAEAMIQARFAVAYSRPRNWDVVRQRILGDCKRPRFADAMRYRVQRGGGWIEGISIRFVEAAVRNMGNAIIETPTVYDDEEKRIVRVVACDLETNTTFHKDVTVTKTTERKSNVGREVVAIRKNSKGETLFVVRATDDEVVEKEARLVSKAMRQCGLRLIPADIVEEASDIAKATRLNAAAQDPDGERKKILDAFVEIGVDAAELEVFLGHSTRQLSPAEIEELRGIYRTVRDGEDRWHSIRDAAVALRRERENPEDEDERSPKSLRSMAEADAAAKGEVMPKGAKAPADVRDTPATTTTTKAPAKSEAKTAETAPAASTADAPCTMSQRQAIAVKALKVFKGATSENVLSILSARDWSFIGGKLPEPITEWAALPKAIASEMLSELAVMESEMRES